MKKLLLTDQLLLELQESVKETFYSMISENMGVASMQRLESPEFVSDLISQVSMSQDTIEAILAISLDKTTLLYMTNKILGTTKSEVDDLVKSCVNEFTNLVFSNLKHKLSNRGYNFKMATPSIVFKISELSAHFENGETFQINFFNHKSPEQKATVNFCMLNTVHN